MPRNPMHLALDAIRWIDTLSINDAEARKLCKDLAYQALEGNIAKVQSLISQAEESASVAEPLPAA